MNETADDIIARLQLQPHPEGGWYRQTWASDETPRATGTCIYFLLKQGEASHWHKVDATEIWHFYTGAPVELSISETETGPVSDLMLGPDFNAGQHPQIIVPKYHWQAARAINGWALVGCTVSPGFTFDGFTLAPPDFDIPR
ncbi:cupin domain-containing protein [Oceaniglobus ichthyenteri]|uniref:cupin domain-containing protein n=1 Tax=Oceaniglobus ichthyenteri TaxID=2136177 RepID=UPI000D33A274|nr:cupin domain-containing protein [Oceaniglobus ichthyenteri]